MNAYLAKDKIKIMQPVITSKGTLFVEFHHVRPILVNGKLANFGDAGTYCVIALDESEGEIIAQAQAILAPEDAHKFNKSIGRKVALKKALVPYFFNKEDRTKVWEKYHSRNKATVSNKIY